MTKREKNVYADYDASIKLLEGAARVRKFPNIVFGSNDVQGCKHTFIEILTNSVDEAKQGYGDTIKVKLLKSGAIAIRDYGRGVPMGYNEQYKCMNWHIIFNELYGGGKYERESVGSIAGQHGMGAASVQFASKYFKAISYREDEISTMYFEEGNPVGELKVEKQKKDGIPCGTYIEWLPDNTVFVDTKIPFDYFVEQCRTFAFLNNLNVYLEVEQGYEDYDNSFQPNTEGDNPLVYLFDGKGKSPTILFNYIMPEDYITGIYEKHLSTKGEEGKLKTPYVASVDVYIALHEDFEVESLYFHNTSKLKDGVSMDAVRDAFKTFFKDIAKKNNITIQPYDYQDFISVLVTSFSSITAFQGQTKSAVYNKFIYDLVYKATLDLLLETKAKKVSSLSEFIDKVIDVAVARKKAKEFELKERELVKTTKGKKPKVEKFIDCKSNNPKEKELYIVEGDSAATAIKSARFSEFQALLPLRGKFLNCEKASLMSLLDNKVIQDLITVLGCGAQLKGSKVSFDINKLQFDKIIIATDEDTDGGHITVLIYLFFYVLMPELLKEGKIYKVDTPLFEITVAGEKAARYVYTLKEKEDLLKELEKKGKKVKKIHRNKGLGEVEADTLSYTAMDPKTRHLTPITVDTTLESVKRLTNMLFGKDTSNHRQQYILEMLEITGADDEIQMSEVSDDVVKVEF